MADEKSIFYNRLWSMAFFLIFSTTMVGISAIIMVATNDYVYYQFYEIATDWVSSGLVDASILTAFEGLADNALLFLGFIDKIWALAFVMFVVEYLKDSYISKRIGYFTIFGFISFGIMATLFILSLVVQLNQTIYDLMFNNILRNITLDLTFFNFYIDNFMIVNFVLICIGLILSFVPLDVLMFKKRKEGDTFTDDEVN